MLGVFRDLFILFYFVSIIWNSLEEEKQLYGNIWKSFFFVIWNFFILFYFILILLEFCGGRETACYSIRDIFILFYFICIIWNFLEEEKQLYENISKSFFFCYMEFFYFVSFYFYFNFILII